MNSLTKTYIHVSFVAFTSLLIVSMLLCSCTTQGTDAAPECSSTALVIGFDPFTATHPTQKGKGFVLQNVDTQETVLTYNLPDTLFNFPPALFQQYKGCFLFPSFERRKFRLNVSYRYANEGEQVLTAGTADVNLAEFIQATKGKQVIILCTRKVIE